MGAQGSAPHAQLLLVIQPPVSTRLFAADDAVGRPRRSGGSAVFVDTRSQALRAHAQRVAPSDASILLWGESGTGKKTLARHVHALSRHAAGPFHGVNCGACPTGQLEHEMLGYEKGAFRGAFSASAGWFEAASTGTLFIDEVQRLPLSLQARLLHVLQTGEVSRLGGRAPVPVQVRLIAATNCDLARAVEEGTFREDLYYLLRVAPLHVPALRERPGDILPLAQHFIERYRARLNYAPVFLSAEAEQMLMRHPWPGNIRELESAVHHAMLLSQGSTLSAECFALVSRLTGTGAAPEACQPRAALVAQLEAVLQQLYETLPGEVADVVETSLFRTAFAHCRHNQVKTAQLLGLSRNVVRGRLIAQGEINALK